MRSEWLGGPGILSAARDSPPPTLTAVTRGDVFTQPEDEYGISDNHYETSVDAPVENSALGSELQTQSERVPEQAPFQNPEQAQQISGFESISQEISTPSEEEACSEKPLDAFTDLKNGSIFAFRGDSRGWSWGWGSAPEAFPPSHSFLHSRTVLL